MRRPYFSRNLSILWLALLALAALLSPASAKGDSPNRAGLVVVHGNGQVITRCIEFEEAEISGFDLLQSSELVFTFEAFGMGGAICSLDNEGCSYPQDSCFCQCQGTPCIYWSYWRLVDGVWRYSNQGASASTATPGAVDGWVWGEGVIGSSANAPPLKTFSEICAPPPTATATAPPTATPTETPVATPTKTPRPPTLTSTPFPTETPTSTPAPTVTATFTPIPAPRILLFTADRSALNFGESAMLRWEVIDAAVILLRYPGGEENVAAQETQPITPGKTMAYTLIARNAAGEVEAEVQVAVNPVFSAPTARPTATPSPSPTPIPTDTPMPLPNPTVEATNTPRPEGTHTPSPTATLMLPPATEAPSPTHTTESIVGAPPDSAGAQTPTATATVALAAIPLVPESGQQGTVATAGDLSASSAQQQKPAAINDPQRQRLLLLGGIVLVAGVPFVFAAIGLLLWFFWRRA